MHHSTWAIILAAGSGSRMGQMPVAKQFLLWRERPLYWHSALTFYQCGGVDGLIFVFPPPICDAEAVRVTTLARRDNVRIPWHVTAGGARRQDSSRNGLALLPENVRRVLIHDAARPFVSASLVRRVLGAVSPECPGVVPAVPVTDTIKLVAMTEPPHQTPMVEATPPRQRLVACQTPQGFWLPTLRLAHERCGDVTDDASMLEQMGARVVVVPGEEGNRKVTKAEDMDWLKEERTPLAPCAGFGYDVHRFGQERPLRLGGVPISGPWGVQAHSDGDVLLHALMDALLGMAAMGDIGVHFPDKDPALEGISSAILLDQVLGWVRERRITLTHVDLTVVAQQPRLGPHAESIRANVAKLLQLSPKDVNFKATTEEGLGFTGAKEGIKAYALVTALKPMSR